MVTAAARKPVGTGSHGRRLRAGYRRMTAYVPRVLWDAVKEEAERHRRTPSAEVICALERWLGWDDE
jgi:hypothetical protein